MTSRRKGGRCGRRLDGERDPKSFLSVERPSETCTQLRRKSLHRIKQRFYISLIVTNTGKTSLSTKVKVLEKNVQLIRQNC